MLIKLTRLGRQPITVLLLHLANWTDFTRTHRL